MAMETEMENGSKNGSRRTWVPFPSDWDTPWPSLFSSPYEPHKKCPPQEKGRKGCKSSQLVFRDQLLGLSTNPRRVDVLPPLLRANTRSSQAGTLFRPPKNTEKNCLARCLRGNRKLTFLQIVHSSHPTQPPQINHHNGIDVVHPRLCFSSAICLA